MAFVKRTWLARIGIGLNKFLIGDRDAQGKQTLVNDPDSISQEGDVISADNLNDLEDRIDNAFGDVDTAISNMKLTKVWTNPDPSQSMAGNPLTNITLDGMPTDLLIEYRKDSSIPVTSFKRVHFYGTGVGNPEHLTSVSITNRIFVASREFFLNPIMDNMRISLYDCGVIDGTTISTDNSLIIPVAVYAVGDITNN